MKRKSIEIPIKKIFCIILAILIIYYGGMKIWAATVETTPVSFADNNLYQSIRTRLSKYIIDRDDQTKTLEIRTDAMPEITELDLSNCQISDLSGMENFTSLITLNLSKNAITDISDLSSLVNLKTLNLSNNTINSISTMNSLGSLTNLNLNSNKISDISTVSRLTNLQILDVSNNAISTATAVKNLPNLTTLNVSQNSSLANLADVLKEELTSLNISSTAITNIEGIDQCRNLVELRLSNNNITDLDPLFETEKVENETVAILRNIEILDVGYTTKNGLSFSNLKKLTKIRELYSQSNGLTSVNGIAEMGDLEYVNLDDNNIEDIDPFRITTTQNGFEVTKFLIPATQISLANNEIEDISVLQHLENIEYLNLSGNHIRDIGSIEKFDFEVGRLNLRNQTIDMPIYKKKNNENHYVILYNIMQSAKNESSVAYAEDANFTTEGVELNTDSTYTVSPYYNVIITPDKTSDDLLTITLHGGVADGTKITFSISTSSSAIETLQFEDPNLDAAIYRYLVTHMNENSYIARAPKIINITQREIANVRELDISNGNIQNLKGLSNFSNLQTLNLSNNNISDDSEIKYLGNLVTLNFANNKLDNKYTAIESLTKIANLDLSGNNIQDLNSINNYLINLEAQRKKPVLTELTLSNNNIKDISTLYNFATLERLNVSNNDITDISYISPHIALNTLNISGNNIEDISVLAGLTNIKTLYMSNNLIGDIKSISNLQLTTLDVSGNRVSDISPLTYQTGLTDLYINNNKIADVSYVESLLLKGAFEAKQQKLTYVLDKDAEGIITVPLPEIFKSAKKSSSKVYTTNEFELENCELTSDGNSLQINTEELGDNKVARATIIGGNADKTMFSVAEALKGTITYNPKDKTKENVVATISFNREGARILNNEGKDTYTFEENDEFTFIYQDEYGFDGEETAVVTWIDKQGPNADVKYNNTEITNQDVEVTINTDEKIANQIEGWEFTNDTNTEMKKTYSQNVDENINIEDELGNATEVNIKINNIDKEQPKITGVENGKTYDKSITPKVEDQNLESVSLTRDGEKINYTNGQQITTNGNYVLTAIDKAGNETKVEFIIEREEIDDTINSNKYEVKLNDLKISKISPQTQLSSFKGNISTEAGYRIENLEGNEISDNDIIGTGYKLITETGKKYTLIVTGDVNGDGQVKLADLSSARKHFLEVEDLQGIYKEAVDIDGNGNITLIDISNIRKVILEKQEF